MKHPFSFLIIILLTCATLVSFAQQYVVSTVAGQITPGHQDGPGPTAKFHLPSGLAFDGTGNLYVADAANHVIRKISTDGTVSTFAGIPEDHGFGDGSALTARFYSPVDVALDAQGNVYVTDHMNHTIRKISTGGNVSTLAGTAWEWGYTEGTGGDAQFHYPYGIVSDGVGNLYVTDKDNHCIRKVSPLGVVTTLTGNGQAGFADGSATIAQFNEPMGIAIDASDNLYVADYKNNRIRKISPAGVVITLAGNANEGDLDAFGETAEFYNPSDVCLDAAGNVYVADLANSRIRKITPTGQVSTVAGSTYGFANGNSATAQFLSPYAVATDASGNVYISDTYSSQIRKMIPLTCSSGSPLAASAGTHVSAIAGADDGGWKPYCNDVGELLLSLSAGTSGAVIPENGVELKIGSTAASYYASGTGFITTPGGAAFFNKTWEVSPTIQPTGSVGVRNYFTQADYNAVNAELTAHSQSPAPALTSLNFYKVTDASLGEHPAVPSITSDKVIIIRNGSAPSTNIWQLGTRAPGSEYYAEFQVTGFSGGGGGSGAAGAALPVTLVTFDATKKEQQTLLTWRTATELNSEHFEVQRSTDGKTWNTLGEVAAAQNTNVEKQYSFTDQQPLPGQNLYRLKMIDLDESFAYSRVRDITFGEVAGASLYPNPARETITLKLDKKYTGTTAKLTSLSGVIIRQIPISSTTQPVDLQALTSGLYFLQLSDGRTIKIVKE